MRRLFALVGGVALAVALAVQLILATAAEARRKKA